MQPGSPGQAPDGAQFPGGAGQAGANGQFPGGAGQGQGQGQGGNSAFNRNSGNFNNNRADNSRTTNNNYNNNNVSRSDVQNAYERYRDDRRDRDVTVNYYDSGSNDSDNYQYSRGRSNYYDYSETYTLPSNCVAFRYGNFSYCNCNGTYYQQRYQGDTIIYVNVPDPSQQQAQQR